MGNSDDADVQLSGALVLPEHCVLHCVQENEEYKLQMTVKDQAMVYVNGHEIEAQTTRDLVHSDRLVIGNHHFFRISLPKPKYERDNRGGTERGTASIEIAALLVAKPPVLAP